MPYQSWIALAFLTVIFVSGCRTAGPNTHAGAALGGLSGAALGAIAGSSEGKSLEGAAIGATAGGLLGGALGNQIDQDIARDDAVRQASAQEAMTRAVSPDTVSEMVASGLSDAVIVEHIRANGILQPLATHELISLKQRGVSDAVINAMQQAPLATSMARGPAIATPYPVYVEERYAAPPPVIYYGRPWRRHHHHCEPGVSWHFEF